MDILLVANRHPPLAAAVVAAVAYAIAVVATAAVVAAVVSALLIVRGEDLAPWLGLLLVDVTARPFLWSLCEQAPAPLARGRSHRTCCNIILACVHVQLAVSLVYQKSFLHRYSYSLTNDYDYFGVSCVCQG